MAKCWPALAAEERLAYFRRRTEIDDLKASATAAVATGNIAGAAALIETALQVHPDDASLYLTRLGLVESEANLSDAEKTKQRKKLYDKALAINPYEPDLLKLRARYITPSPETMTPQKRISALP